MFGAMASLWLACSSNDDGQRNYSLLPLAGGARIDKVSVYQGVEKNLYKAPGIFTFGSVPPPVLAGRDLIVRVAASHDEESPARVAVVTLNFSSDAGDLSLGEVVDLGREWEDWDATSTAQFSVPAELVTEGSKLEVAIRDTTLLDPVAGSTEHAIWSSEEGSPGGGLPRSLNVEPAEGFRLVIVPIRYEGDGSGRLPDTTPAQVERFREAILAAYPLAWVDVSVEQTLPWTIPLLSSGSGWGELLNEISQMRVEANVPENTYYYGLFSPAKSLDEFCANGCQLGLSLLAFTAGDTAAKASIGVGWTGDDSVETLLHEVGHAHGRDHAPCGTSGDLAYPYPAGGIGAWGYDQRSGEYLDAETYKDVMSYCGPVWVSDYTFNALHQRVLAVAQLAGARSGLQRPAEWESWLVRDGGRAERSGTVFAANPPGGQLVTVWVDGTSPHDGWFSAFDHQAGGVVWVKPMPPEVEVLTLYP